LEEWGIGTLMMIKRCREEDYGMRYGILKISLEKDSTL